MNGNFDVSSISGSYNDLLCVAIVRGTNASTSDNIDFRFNNDNTTHYYREVVIAGTGSTALVSAQTLGDVRSQWASSPRRAGSRTRSESSS